MITELFWHFLPATAAESGPPPIPPGGEQAQARLAGLGADLDLGISDLGIVYLFSAHPAAELVPPPAGTHNPAGWQARTLTIRLVGITDQAAADWIRQHFPAAAGLTMDRGTINKAFRRWMDRGAAAKSQGNKKRWSFKAPAAAAWTEQRRRELDQAEQRWAARPAAPAAEVLRDVSACCAAVRDVAPSLKERKKENSLFPISPEGPPAAGDAEAIRAAFRGLPDEVWTGTDGAAYELVREWWNAAGPARPAIDHLVFLGGVLAARKNAHTAPVNYAAGCVARGLFESWITAARRLAKQREANRRGGAVPVPR